jgi:hypothetical protein
MMSNRLLITLVRAAIPRHTRNNKKNNLICTLRPSLSLGADSESAAMNHRVDDEARREKSKQDEKCFQTKISRSENCFELEHALSWLGKVSKSFFAS